MSLNSGFDQAAGLRRMLGSVSTRCISFLSAIPAGQKNAVMLNLAAALVQLGRDVHLLDASQSDKGIGSLAVLPATASLSDMAELENDLPSLFQYAPGVYLSRLATQPLVKIIDKHLSRDQLSRVLREIKPEVDFCLADTDLLSDNPFLLHELAQGDVVVIVSPTADSIKSAYLQIKSLHSLLGRRPYQIMVVDASPEQANLIVKNMSNAANNFLAVPLIFLGSIPADQYFLRAVKMQRPVIEAFPTAIAAIAFRGIAGYLAEQSNDILHG